MATREKPKRAVEPAEPPERDDWTWAEPENLKVKTEFQRLIPLQSREEYRALKESIKEEGCREPLLVWKGHNVVLDGHTRRDLCIEFAKKVKVREVELADEKAATAFILRLQRQRRNLTREAMSYFRGVEYNAVKQQHGGSRPGRKPKGQSDLLKSTARQLAEQYGVSEKTIKRDGVFALAIDRIVAEHGDPELKRKLLGADVKLTHALARWLLVKPPGERKAAVDQLIEQEAIPRPKKEGVLSARPPKEMAESLVTRLKAKGDEHARAVLEQMADLLGLVVRDKPSEP